MRKLSILFLMLFLFGCAAQNLNLSNRVGVQTDQGEVIFNVELARSPEQIRRGLMFRDSLPISEGMFFVYADEETLNFWMKNTLIPLDMLFINDDFKVVRVQKNARPCAELAEACEIYSSGVPARYVLEIFGGLADSYGIVEGADVSINFEI